MLEDKRQKQGPFRDHRNLEEGFLPVAAIIVKFCKNNFHFNFEEMNFIALWSL